MYFQIAAFLCAENLMIQTKRYRGKVNIQRPRKPHFDRAVFNAVTEPIYPPAPITDKCRQKQIQIFSTEKLEKEPHPYMKILARECRECFETNRMMLLCHKNSVNQYDLFKFRVALHKHGIKLKMYGRGIIKAALKDSKYANLVPLITSMSQMIFSSEPKVPEVLKALRKTPQLILMTGIIDDRILSRNELTEYATLPDIQVLRAQFAATLSSAAGGQIYNNLQSHQSNLCYLLDAHAKALETPNSANDADKPEETETK